MIDFAVLDPADRRHRFDRGPDHEARRRRALVVGAEAAAQGRPDQRAEDGVDAGASAAGCFRGFQFVEPLAVGGEAAGDEQFGDQFVLGAEMIVHRREIDVGGGDDVAQRDVGEAAIGIKPFGGAQDRGSGMIRRHVMATMRHRRNAGSCNSNSCMKLWFEGWNVNAQRRIATPANTALASSPRRKAR